MGNLIERLKQSDIFGELTDAELTDIAQFCHEEAHQENAVLLTEDARASGCFWLSPENWRWRKRFS